MFVRVAAVVAVAAFLWAVFVHDSGASGPERRYRVQPGDTLWSIVERTYAGDPRAGVWKLQRSNGLSDATIVPGEVLVLRY